MIQSTSKQLVEKFNTYLQQLSYTREPKGLYAPIEYVLGLGGKRLRPTLMLLTYNLYREDVERILPQAAGLEIYHNFTLLHDDVMDRADMRRGKPTVHIKWNDNAAILSGDAMVSLATCLMLQDCPTESVAAVMEAFSRATLEVCEGQQWDMEFENRTDVTVDEYLEMIRLKTSVLLAAPFEIGARMAGASDEDVKKLYEFGVKIGLAFQLQDDYLDVYGDPTVFGKKIGGDICCNKKTFMLITAYERAQGETKAELERWIQAETFNREEKIEAVTAIYNKEGIAEACLEQINRYFEEGLQALRGVSVDESLKQHLKNYVGTLMDRKL